MGRERHVFRLNGCGTSVSVVAVDTCRPVVAAVAVGVSFAGFARPVLPLPPPTTPYLLHCSLFDMAGKVDKEITRELDRLRLGSMSEDIVKGGERLTCV